LYNHRLAIVLAGSGDWALYAAATALSSHPSEQLVWLSERDLDGRRVPISQGEKLLGSEVDVLVYDAHSGFDPDNFGAALGALRGGGLLLLLTPPLDHWPEEPDPQAGRLVVHQFAAEQVEKRFVRRLARTILESHDIVLLSESDPIPLPSTAARAGDRSRPDSIGDYRTPDQQRAVDAILKTANGRARRPLILTSDRGRGKSSALGIAAARLLDDKPCSILATAPRRSAVDPLFDHASRLLPNAEVHTNRISYRDGLLHFHPPDELCRSPRNADLLLVDEAAGIPAPLLERLLRTHPRVVFATTVHGYEGTGRGFEVRFRRTLDRDAPGWREVRMETPIRWAPDDPVERLAASALLLDAAPADGALVAEAHPRSCRFQHLDRDVLVENEDMLSQLFGLLVLAHYQTRPMDLRHLLDGPNIRVYAIFHEEQVVATALVAVEGGFGSDLARDIFEGRRRPRGHLLPQTLSAHAGIEEATGRTYARVIRIAVHPEVQGRGLGRLLLDGIVEDAHTQDLDLVGSSFGATADLLAFWKRCGFPAVHLGTSRNAASGAHAAVVLRPLSCAGESLQLLALNRLGRHLPTLLAGPLRDLEPEIASVFLRDAPGVDWTPDDRERRELAAFAFALRPVEASLPPLAMLVCSRFGEALSAGALDDLERDVLIYKALQHRGWAESARLLGLPGRAQVVALLRRAAGKVVGQRHSDDAEC
jgi:tRNA(Met) cytidine acetyltransferase